MSKSRNILFTQKNHQFKARMKTFHFESNEN